MSKKKNSRSNDTIYLSLFLLIGTTIVLYSTGFAFNGFSTTTNGSWYNTSWHYRIRIDINSTITNRTDWPVELKINFTNQMPSGTFDINSLRLFEYNSMGALIYEVPSQFDVDDYYSNATNAIGDFVFILNGTTAPNTKRIFYLYYDALENDVKPAKTYASSINYSWTGQIVTINGTILTIVIDTNRGESTSGISYVDERNYYTPIIIAGAPDRTAEYLEYFNGTVNTTFDLRNNASFIQGPARMTIRQEGPEVEFGNTSRPTGVGHVVKKYYIYNRAGPQSYGSFIKVSQEIFFNATVNRSNQYVGALALDFQRTSLAQLMTTWNSKTTNPYSWAWANDGSGEVAGIINVNESATNFFSAVSTDLGRIGTNMSDTTVQSGTSIKDVALLYFATGGGDAVSEFMKILNGTASNLDVRLTAPEKWSVIIIPSINATIFNRNETILVKGNVTIGDVYNITRYMNATIDLGTPSTADDVTLRLYDDGTSGDEVVGDGVFTNNYTINTTATLGQWTINFTAFGNTTEYLNSTIFNFNVTNIYNVSVAIINPSGLTNRVVFANVSVKNFIQTSFVHGTILTCIENGVDVVNKTDNNDGTFSINFTSPANVGAFNLFCNATKANNAGNDTQQFLTEPPKTYTSVNITPNTVSTQSITLYNNDTFSLSVNVTNTGQGVARSTNITTGLLSGWSSNVTLESCGNIGVNQSCLRFFNITIPNNTSPGNYSVNSTVLWVNPDEVQNSTNTSITVTVFSNPMLIIQEENISGTGVDGIQINLGFFTILSLGNDVVHNITFNCTSGSACQYFNLSFLPENISSINVSKNVTVSMLANIPVNYTPGIYNGTINASSYNTSDTAVLFMNLQNTTTLSVVTHPISTVAQKTIYQNVSFSILTDVTNTGNSSANNINISFSFLSDWAMNSSFEDCSNLLKNATCERNNSVSIPNNATTGEYSVNITITWTNLDNTQNSYYYIFNVTVGENPIVSIDNGTLEGSVPPGYTYNAFNLTILSIGSSNITNVSFACISGMVCSNFSLSFTPNIVSSLAPGSNTTVAVNVSVPQNYRAGTYNGTLNVSAANDGSTFASLFVTVTSNRSWSMAPVLCERSEYPDVGKVCDVTVTNTGNDAINFTIVPIIANKTSSNVTNFTVGYAQNYTFSIVYNITGYPQSIYNSTFMVSSLQDSTPANATINVSLVPYVPPSISLDISPTLSEQNSEVTLTATVEDTANAGLTFVNITVTKPDGTNSTAEMAFVDQSGSTSVWSVAYGGQIPAYGNTSLRGAYNVTVHAGDNIGNVGNATSNFTIRLKINIASYTLSSRYYQADSGTIFYSARETNNSGVHNVSVNFYIYDINSTLLYQTSRVTDTYGTFTPLPVFSLASDSPVGNYTLSTVSTYNDTVAKVVFSTQNNYNFAVSAKTVSVTGLFADIETAVVWFPSNIMRFNMLVYDGEGKTVDPSTMALTVYDPAQNVYFTSTIVNMVKRGTGFYTLSYAMPTNTATGMYLAVVNITKNELSTMKLQAFRVAQGGPYDVRISLAKNEVEQGTPLGFNVIIENKGEVTQDVYVNYTVTSVADGTTYYTASEAVLTPAFTNQSFTRNVFIFSGQPLGTYRLTANVKYDNTQPAINATATFVVIAARIVIVPGTGGTGTGGGGGGSAGGGVSPGTGGVINVETPGSLRSLIIEKYNDNIKMYPGFTRIDYVTVRNTGNVKLDKVSLNIAGIPESWFNITPDSYKQIAPENSSVFLVEYHIPKDANLGDYKANLIVTSTSSSDQKSITITIVKSIVDIILAEIEKAKTGLRNLLIDIGAARNEGKNVDDVLLLTDSIEKKINSAEYNLNLNNTETALNDITDAKILIDKAKDLLSKLRVPEQEAKGIDLFIIIAFAVAFSGVSGGLFLLKKRSALPKNLSGTINHFVHIIEKIRRPVQNTDILEKEKEKLTRMTRILDSEKKEGIVSEESYNEMKKSIESKLSKIQKKVSK